MTLSKSLPIALSGLLFFSSVCIAEDPSDTAIFDQLAGDWAFHEDGSACTQKYTNVSFNEDRTRATFKYFGEATSYDGRQLTDSHYRVLAHNNRSITMLLDGEKRTLENGKPIEWVMEPVGDNVFVWRMSHWPADLPVSSEYIWPYRRVRCHPN